MRRAGAVCPIPERPLPVYGREDLLLQLPRPLLQVGNADLFQTQRKLEAYAAKNAARVEAETAEPAPAPSAKTTAKEKMPGARRSGTAIMGRLIGLVKPLLPVMLLAIFLGVVGYLCAISLTILASHGVVLVMTERTTKTLTTILIVVAVARGLLHYGEQYCNHFIAFKLLAIIRHKVFAVLRRLCPAKLEGRDRGDLISILTADIELLEVFYAHTISPIAIAVIVSVIMLIFIGTRSLGAALIALGGYLAVGLIVPLWNGRRSAAAGMSFRERFGEMNSFMLESLRGLDETIQYGHGAKRMGEITRRSRAMGAEQKELNRFEQSQRAVTNLLIELFSIGMLFFMLAATVLLQVFAAARQQSARAGRVAAVTAEGQNLADALYAGADAEALLPGLGFEKNGERWVRAGEDVRVTVSSVMEEGAGGAFLRQEVLIEDADGTQLLRLPCSRYLGVNP